MSPDLILNTVPGWLFLGAFLCLCIRQILSSTLRMVRLLEELMFIGVEKSHEKKWPIVKRTSSRAVVPGQIKRSRPKNRASAPEENQ